MTAFYEIIAGGPPPVSLVDMKAYLRISFSQDDGIISALLDAVTEYGEKYTGRDFRVNTWRLFLDAFTTRIPIVRNPVDIITTVKYLKSGSLTTVASSTYYLKNLTQSSEILLNVDEEWPTDGDEREQAIEIEFQTKVFELFDQ